VELVRSLGAHHVVDYTREDFTRRGERYDVVIDCVWSRSVAESRRLLAPPGRYVIVGVVPGRIGRAMLAGFASAGHVSMMLAKGSPHDRATLADLMRDGKVVPVIDRTYPLAQAREAILYLEGGHARGKVVIEVAADR
jgi:NADPH:quinone reductase-like Zn-dependent oxidoreductase